MLVLEVNTKDKGVAWTPTSLGRVERVSVTRPIVIAITYRARHRLGLVGSPGTARDRGGKAV